MGIISITAIIVSGQAYDGRPVHDGRTELDNDLEETRNWFVLRFWAVVYTVVFLVGDCFTPLVLVFGKPVKGTSASTFRF